MCVCMYICLEVDRVICSCTLLCTFLFAEFCPEPAKHIGQPPVFNISDEEDDEETEVMEEDYIWGAGVSNKTTFRTAL